MAQRAVEGAGAPVAVWEALQGSPRPAATDYSGVVVFGSVYNVEHAADQPFINDARSLTSEAIEAGVPYPRRLLRGAAVGVVAGGGGRRRPRSARWGSSPSVRAEAAAADPLLSHLAIGDMDFQWHMDTFTLPDDANAARGRRQRDEPGLPGGRSHVGSAVPPRGRPVRSCSCGCTISAPEEDLLSSGASRPIRSWPNPTVTKPAMSDEVVRSSSASFGSRPRRLRNRSRREQRYRPLVAVVGYHLADDRVARWPQVGYGVPAPYLDALRRAGARTAIVAPGEAGDADELLEPFDGLVLVGGGDVDPARYQRRARRRAQLRRRTRS